MLSADLGQRLAGRLRDGGAAADSAGGTPGVSSGGERSRPQHRGASADEDLKTEDRGCFPKPTLTYDHISVEGWTESYQMLWDDIERDFPQTAPRNLGNMGYFGKTSLFLPASVQQAAYSAEGLILEFYRGFNVSWTDPSKYFEAPSILESRHCPFEEVQ
eukprot:g6713.t1